MRRHAFTPVHAMVVIILLASLLASATSAQPAPCPAEYPYDPAVGTCVDPETGEPVDPTTGDPLNPGEGQEPTAVPTVELPAGDLASFTLYHLACDDDFDPNGVRDAGGLGSANGCLTYGTPPFTYTISANGTAVITSTLEATERDFARYDVPGPIPAGTLTITIAPVAGYTTEFISCGLEIGEAGTDVIEPPVADGTTTLSTLPDQKVECWVYNVTRVPDPTVGDTIITSSGGSVNMSFLSLSCPAGTTIDAELDRNCTEGLANVTYEILSETATLARNTTDGNGVLIFENVPDGQLAIVESVPAGYGKPYVLCTHYSPTTGDREYAPTIEYGTGFTASVAPGDDLNCTWFNFPAAGPDNGPTIMIQTRWCEGYENGFAADASLAEAEASCPPFSAREEFQVSLDGQAVATDQSNDINGQVTFTKLPVSESGGLYGIALLAHQDAQTVAVYCDKGTGDGVYAVVPSPLSAPDRIDQQLAAGETLRCSWFINYPYGPTGTVASDPPLTVASDPPLQEVEPGIFLVARLCNPGADLTQTDIDAACPTPGNGIGFNVVMAGEPYITTTTDAAGVIDVPLPAGDATFTITPQVPAGYGLPGYLCVSLQTGSGGGGKVVRLTADAPSHDVAWSSNSETTCTYYFPVVAEEDANEEQDGDTIQGVVGDPSEATGADITIATYLCPAGTTATEDLVATCTQRASGVTFSLVTATTTLATQTSDAAGDIFFADVAPNDYGITATLPAGFGTPIVLCYHAFANGVVEEGAEDIVFGNQFRFTVFDDGESLECAWYNVPAQGADTGPNIFIEARTCSPGTAVSASMTVFDAQGLCPNFYIDLEFQVLNVDQVIATARTNDDFLSAGQVFFTKLPEPASGAFGVTAGVREGERTLAVFCDQDFGDGTFQIVPVRVSGDRLDQETGMGAGDTLRCTWFVEMNPLMTGTHAPDAPVQEAAPGEVGDEALLGPQDGPASPAASAGEDDPGSETAGETGLTVLALRCPPEVAGQDVALDELCTEPIGGLTFEIFVDDASIGTSVTDATGELAIPAEAGAGTYLFRQQPAADLLEMRTACASVYPDGTTASGQSTAVGAEMSELYLAYDGASRVTCTFYFVMDSTAPQTGDATEDQAADSAEGQATPPAAAGADTGDTEMPSLTLTFRTCPDGTDQAADPAALEQTCAVETVERYFMLTRDNVSTTETVVGTGTWTFTDPVVYADIGVAHASRVSCTAGGTEGAAQVPATADLDGGLLTVTLEPPATAVACDWFIFPD